MCVCKLYLCMYVCIHSCFRGHCLKQLDFTTAQLLLAAYTLADPYLPPIRTEAKSEGKRTPDRNPLPPSSLSLHERSAPDDYHYRSQTHECGYLCENAIASSTQGSRNAKVIQVCVLTQDHHVCESYHKGDAIVLLAARRGLQDRGRMCNVASYTRTAGQRRALTWMFG